MSRSRPNRRDLLAGGLALAAANATPSALRAAEPAQATLRVDRPGAGISPLVFGSNEIGAMDGGQVSSVLDRRAGVTARRFGGDLTTTYNWVNNACNAGKNHNQANGDFLLEALRIPGSERNRPAVVIEAMHEASLDMGARSLVTMPLSPFVAADMDGAVSRQEAAPSRRFTPTNWALGANARAPIDARVCDLPQLLSRLVDQYGDANSARGVFAYALDNEPALWAQNHPRVSPSRMSISAFIARSIAAARAIKTIDPSAKVFGPSSWGATEMANFQNAPDWSAHARYGNFLALYLDAFRRASEQDGRRLLDALDVHWYPFANGGQLFRTDTEALDSVRLDAPRSLTEDGFREESWVSRALGRGDGEGLGLPVLPSLRRIIARNFPDTKLAISEFNYGLGRRIPSALALADALGRYATSGVYLATHWGSLDHFLAESYRLYRASDARGGMFGGRAMQIEHSAQGALSAFAAEDNSALRIVLINKTHREVALDLALTDARPREFRQTLGFDEARPIVGERAETPLNIAGGCRLVAPALSARRYLFA